MLLLVLSGTVLFVGTSYSFPETPPSPLDELATKSEPTEKPEPIKPLEKSKPTPEQEPETGPASELEAELFPTIESDEETLIEEQATEKVVFLTFDDGPSKWTEQFLDVLKAHHVQATFFMQGGNLKKKHLQESVQRVTREGHYIGGHSMTHDYKTLYTHHQFVPEMIESLSLIHEITGTNPSLVRAPYGSAPGLNGPQIRQQLADSNIKIWDWTIDSHDWELPGNPSQIIQNIKQETTSDREVVLMHEKAQTLEALPGILEFFKNQGYEFAVYHDTSHFVLNFQNDSAL